MSEEQLLLEIIKANNGIVVHTPDVNELCWQVFHETGTMIIPKKQVDDYESTRLDWYGEPYINQRINKRKYLLKI